MAPCWFHRIPPQSEQGPVPETDPFPFAVIEEMQSNQKCGTLVRNAEWLACANVFGPLFPNDSGFPKQAYNKNTVGLLEKVLQ